MLALATDFGIFFLLLGTLIYMIILNKRLSAIHNNRTDIEKLLENFSSSLTKGELSLFELQDSSKQFEQRLQEKIQAGTSLTDDLAFFIDRGESLVTDLENEVRKARDLRQELTQGTFQQNKSTKKTLLKRPPLSGPVLKDPIVLQKIAGLH